MCSQLCRSLPGGGKLKIALLEPKYAWGRTEGRGGAEPRLTTSSPGCRAERLRQWLRKKGAEMCLWPGMDSMEPTTWHGQSSEERQERKEAGEEESSSGPTRPRVRWRNWDHTETSSWPQELWDCFPHG